MNPTDQTPTRVAAVTGASRGPGAVDTSFAGSTPGASQPPEL